MAQLIRTCRNGKFSVVARYPMRSKIQTPTFVTTGNFSVSCMDHQPENLRQKERLVAAWNVLSNLVDERIFSMH
jgi:hypothetical protein